MKVLLGAAIALAAINGSLQANAQRTTYTEEEKSHFEERVVLECKDRFLEAISKLYPQDLPGHAFEDLTI